MSESKPQKDEYETNKLKKRLVQWLAHEAD